jgi:hypothetical protein
MWFKNGMFFKSHAMVQISQKKTLCETLMCPYVPYVVQKWNVFQISRKGANLKKKTLCETLMCPYVPYVVQKWNVFQIFYVSNLQMPPHLAIACPLTPALV